MPKNGEEWIQIKENESKLGKILEHLGKMGKNNAKIGENREIFGQKYLWSKLYIFDGILISLYLF